MASVGSIHLSSTAYSVNFNLTATIIHGIINSIHHKATNVPYKIIHKSHLQIVSRFIAFQKFLIFASTHLIKSKVNHNNQIENMIHNILVNKSGIRVSHCIHNI